MRPGRDKRLASLIKRLAADFLERKVAEELILTVNRVALDEAGRQAKIYVTIFPDAAELAGIRAARRLRRPFQEFLKSQLRGHNTPYLDVLIDEEEKQRRVKNITENK